MEVCPAKVSGPLVPQAFHHVTVATTMISLAVLGAPVVFATGRVVDGRRPAGRAAARLVRSGSAGYFDQAHFIHDFRAFSGSAPPPTPSCEQATPTRCPSTS